MKLDATFLCQPGIQAQVSLSVMDTTQQGVCHIYVPKLKYEAGHYSCYIPCCQPGVQTCLLNTQEDKTLFPNKQVANYS